MKVTPSNWNFQPRITRRSILRGAPAAALALTASAATAFQGPVPAEPDPLPGWFEEWRRNRASWTAMVMETDETPESEALWDRRMELERLIANTPAKTKEGIAAQIGWVIEEAGNDMVFDGHREALEMALAGLKRGMV